jgi:hypothetical protein
LRRSIAGSHTKRKEIEQFIYDYSVSVQDADLFLCFRLAYFKAAYALYDSDFYVKADDDIYLRPGENNIPISPSSDCLIGIPPFENVDAYTGYFSFCR